MGNNTHIDNELVKSAQNASVVNKIERLSALEYALHKIGILSIYFLAFVIAIIIVLAVVFFISNLNNYAVNAMGFSIIGAVLGAIVSHLLTKK